MRTALKFLSLVLFTLFSTLPVKADVNLFYASGLQEIVYLSSSTTTIKGNTGNTILALDSSSKTATFSGIIIPAIDGDNTYSNLGSSLNGFKNIYLSDGTRKASIFMSNGLYVSYPSGQSILFREASTDKWIMLAGTTSFLGAAANQACNTTCTAPCVFGMDTGYTTNSLLACTDATADVCLCAGAS